MILIEVAGEQKRAELHRKFFGAIAIIISEGDLFKVSYRPSIFHLPSRSYTDLPLSHQEAPVPCSI